LQPTTELFRHPDGRTVALVYRVRGKKHVVTRMGKDGTMRLVSERHDGVATLFGALKLKLVIDGFQRPDEKEAG
jgi:hypothetical protein